MPSANQIQYDAEITGAEAPFKWKLYRINLTGGKTPISKVNGESDTFEEACFDAQAAAVEAHDTWLNDKRVTWVTVHHGAARLPVDDSDPDGPATAALKASEAKPTNPATTPDPITFMD